MSIEGPKRLSQDEAHDEANMLRAKVGVSPETGKIPEAVSPFYERDYVEGKEPSAEDYDNALAALEELKKIAEEEPDTVKILHKLRDLPIKVGSGLDLAFRAIGVGINSLHPLAAFTDPDNKPDEGFIDAMKRRWERTKTAHENENAAGMWHDAENELRALKARAKQFERKG
jgi:hypothetical protein